MRRDVYHYVETYHICQVSKVTATNVGLYMLLTIPTQPWTNISMVFVLEFPHSEEYGFNIYYCGSVLKKS